jgi:hypothetical protein
LEFLAIYFYYFYFYIGGHFEMAAILKSLKTKSTTLSDDLFLCQVSKGSQPFWFAMAAILKTPPIWAKFGFQVDYDVAN